MQAVVTVVGSDKVGIVAGITATLADLNVNILEMSQTLMRGAFTMMMVVSIEDGVNFLTLQEKIQAKGDALGVRVHLQNEAIFNAMHEL
ncbi:MULTISPECIES: ACT domain-containing protein [unclassified Lactococcus]|uniref:ACT domain-containing protein n=1 Tax=unclassified Lactococcus TaxID=2643510 RepID=UPI0011C901FF|nr:MULTISPECIES: ACT domain-containing protein [unclassified Lactococcus]MQW23625.1 ACT domain-containing protein [Lactococcus sp. dk101]TXK37638.1 ACT domain-containing protein [Lactococcus sp. dk310]TXK49076.1 ACT domain-containing protein [Lactococcus sp. dk322]